MSNFENLVNLIEDLKIGDALIYANTHLKSERTISAFGLVFYKDEKENLLYKFSNTNQGVLHLQNEAQIDNNLYTLPIIFENPLMQVYQLPDTTFANMEEVDSYFKTKGVYSSIYDYLRANKGLISFFKENKLDSQIQTEYQNLAIYLDKLVFINYGCNTEVENQLSQIFLGQAQEISRDVDLTPYLEIYTDD